MNPRRADAAMFAAPRWLPPGRRAAVCFTIDDVHPGRFSDAYEAGGELDRGALGHVAWLLERHPYLKVTLFVTPDWREREPFLTRKWLSHAPYLRDRLWLARRLRPGTMRLDRHPAFVEYLQTLPRTEIALHGLHHVHRGRQLTVEFQEQDVEECRQMLGQALTTFADAGLPRPAGMTPPGWNAPPALLEAMSGIGFRYVASSRDIRTPVRPGATTAMSGLTGMPLTSPQRLSGGLLHLPVNVQATSDVDRVDGIVAIGGLVSVKAHIVKTAFGYTALDGLDVLYRNYLDLMFTHLHHRYGESLWWSTMGEVAEGSTQAREESTA